MRGSAITTTMHRGDDIHKRTNRKAPGDREQCTEKYWELDLELQIVF